VDATPAFDDLLLPLHDMIPPPESRGAGRRRRGDDSACVDDDRMETTANMIVAREARAAGRFTGHGVDDGDDVGDSTLVFAIFRLVVL
jgi:hypothetical protein